MVRKFLSATGISLGLLSILMFVGIPGTNQNIGTTAYGAMMYDKGDSTSNNSTIMMKEESSMTHRAAVGQIACST